MKGERNEPSDAAAAPPVEPAPGVVAVTIVTWESARWLARCLDALAHQTLPPAEVVVLDNASCDRSATIAAGHGIVTQVLRQDSNLGFAAGQNRAIRATAAPWVLVLNPDAFLEPTFLERLLERARVLPRTGALCGKLLRAGDDGAPLAPVEIDSSGMIVTRAFRHLDRGSGEPDHGQYDTEEAVFGATGAGVLLSRAMLDDIAVEGEVFDERFFAYREDADLAWRAQLLGWDCLYVPRAVGYHVRRVLPERRRELPAAINRASVRNRFLMRIKNADAAVWWRCGWRGLARDVVVVGGCLAREWSSLGAFLDVARETPRALRWRQAIRVRRRRPAAEVAQWFR